MTKIQWKVFFELDKFGVGDEFVHELLMGVDDFPIESYLIKQCRPELNKQVKITTTPGPHSTPLKNYRLTKLGRW